MKTLFIEVLNEDTGEVLLKDSFNSVESMQEKLYKVERVMKDEDILPTENDPDEENNEISKVSEIENENYDKPEYHE